MASPKVTIELNSLQPNATNLQTRPSEHETQRLLTDRAAYLSYLEVQLERVSAACITSQAFGFAHADFPYYLFAQQQFTMLRTDCSELQRSHRAIAGADPQPRGQGSS